MEDLPRKILTQIIAQYGPGLIDEPRRLKGLLKDLCSSHERENRALIDALELGVARDWHTSLGGALPAELLASTLTQRLLDKTPMSREMSRWAVESWAAALGVVLLPIPTQVPLVSPSGISGQAKNPVERVEKPTAFPASAPIQKEQERAAGPANQVEKNIPGLVSVTGLDQSAPPIQKNWKRFAMVGSGLVALFIIGGAAVWSLWGQHSIPLAPAQEMTTTLTATSALIPTATNTATLIPTISPTLVLTFTVVPTISATSTFTLVPIATQDLTIPPTCNTIGQTWNSPVDGMTLICVPGGKFMMGSAANEKGTDTDEFPQHEVSLNAFWIDKTEVTNAMYQKCVGTGNCSAPNPTTSYSRNSYYGNAQFGNYPVIYVSWHDANAYCRWVGRSLPTEAEWEMAARGTDGRIYPWGNTAPDANRANFNSNVGDTTEVGKYPSGTSSYGALDMAGNVWEWVADWYGDYSSASLSNPTGPAGGNSRVLRGGSWYFSDSYLRVADRANRYPSYRDGLVGFRCGAPPG